MKLLKSAPIVDALAKELRTEVVSLVDRGINPHLAVILVGNHPESLRYIGIKTRKAKEAGITVSLYHLEEDAPDSEIISVLDFLSNDEEIHGIIVQLPLPKKRSPAKLQEIFSHVRSEKDVDGLRGEWRAQHYSGATAVALRAGLQHALPPMVAAVCLLLDYYNITLADKKIVIVGRGMLVGQPLEALLKDDLHLDVTVVDEETENILAITQSADILIAGTGQPDLITYQWIKEGAVVLDCSQDVHRDSVDQVASAVAPSVGGLGPLTVSWLLFNTLRATVQQTS
jgi:methylenetetrahydrofolate dehydrogenase (NADP+)/methenyltetrahydrofolate cyclohydrolase